MSSWILLGGLLDGILHWNNMADTYLLEARGRELGEPLFALFDDSMSYTIFIVFGVFSSSASGSFGIEELGRCLSVS